MDVNAGPVLLFLQPSGEISELFCEVYIICRQLFFFFAAGLIFALQLVQQ